MRAWEAIVRRTVASAFVCLFSMTFTGMAHAMSRGPLRVEVLVNGRPLAEFPARGTTYVEAQRGAEYALRLTNQTGTRLAVALSVDGLNTIDARTGGARDASKWVLGPYESAVISGWQTDSATARRFFFTTEDRSYGAWLGRTANLGLISAVAYRERVPEIVPYAGQIAPAPRRDRGEAKGEAGSNEAAPAPPAAAGAERESRADASLRKSAPSESAPSAALDDFAATGIGRPVDHAVEQVALDLESAPAARIDLRYEYHDALVRLGVLGDALARRERAQGFCPAP